LCRRADFNLQLPLWFHPELQFVDSSASFTKFSSLDLPERRFGFSARVYYSMQRPQHQFSALPEV
jgi:hypothetical protein